ncbi:MAG TPA: hypothetical protein VLI39_11610 [Sedimentisphaerales bacterium]|nr:hypothetical protein [Sedimentisphaerales bacterium]
MKGPRIEARELKEAQAAEARKKPSQISDGRLANKTPDEFKRFNRLTVDQIEKMIMQVEQEIDAMKQQFGSAEIYKNPDRLADL